MLGAFVRLSPSRRFAQRIQRQRCWEHWVSVTPSKQAINPCSMGSSIERVIPSCILTESWMVDLREMLGVMMLPVYKVICWIRQAIYSCVQCSLGVTCPGQVCSGSWNSKWHLT